MHLHQEASDLLVILGNEAPVAYTHKWWPGMPAIRTHVVHPVPTDTDDPIQSFQVPYPSDAAVWSGTSERPVPPLTRRPLLAALFASTAGMLNAGAEPLRKLLGDECARASDCAQPSLGLTRAGVGIGAAATFSNSSEISTNAVLEELAITRNSSGVADAYARAVFCLQPWGDSATRKGYVDAILLGCIPVIFASELGWDQLTRWFPSSLHLLVPTSVFLPGGSGVLAHLRATSAETRARYHHNVMHARRQLQYAMHAGTPPPGDALDTALRGMVAHFEARRHADITANGTTACSRRVEAYAWEGSESRGSGRRRGLNHSGYT